MNSNARRMENSTATDEQYQRLVEPPGQGGRAYDRCRGCGRELLVDLGGRQRIEHGRDCPHARE